MGIGSPGTDNNALHELRDSVKDLSKTLKESSRTTETLTKILVIFAFLQLSISLLQLIIPDTFFKNPWIAFVTEAVFICVIVYTFRKSKLLEKEEKE